MEQKINPVHNSCICPTCIPHIGRPNWDEYFIGVAKAVSARATCPRAAVGAILVRDNRILATGYTGSLPGTPHCIDEGCILNDEGRFCSRVIHAETNVLYQCAKFGIESAGATMYFWDSRDRDEPCGSCLPAIVSTGIIQIINRRFQITEVDYGQIKSD